MLTTYSEWKASLKNPKIKEQKVPEPIEEGLCTLKEWRKLNESVLSRREFMTHDDTAALHAPAEGDYVYYLEGPRPTTIYRVFRKTNDSLALLDNKHLAKGTLSSQTGSLIVPSKDWHEFRKIEFNLLTPAERKKFGNNSVWVMGPGKDSFIKNRNSVWSRRVKKIDALDTTPKSPEISQSDINSIRAQLLGDKEEKAPEDTSDLRAKLLGDEPIPARVDDLTNKIRQGWLKQDRRKPNV